MNNAVKRSGGFARAAAFIVALLMIALTRLSFRPVWPLVSRNWFLFCFLLTVLVSGKLARKTAKVIQHKQIIVF